MISQLSNEPLANNQQIFCRITRDSQAMEGKACIRGMRLIVCMIVAQLGARRTIENVHFPDLERENVLAALQYAAVLARRR